MDVAPFTGEPLYIFVFINYTNNPNCVLQTLLLISINPHPSGANLLILSFNIVISYYT